VTIAGLEEPPPQPIMNATRTTPAASCGEVERTGPNDFREGLDSFTDCL